MLAFSIRNLLDYPCCTYLTFSKLVAVNIFIFFIFLVFMLHSRSGYWSC